MLDPLPIVPFTRPARGAVTLPGSKSITNRALILAALSDRTVTLGHALFSQDTRLMIDALRVLGFAVETNEPGRLIRIAGRGGEIPVGEARIAVGNAGTVARFLTAFVCLRPGGVYHFTGDEAMRRRPIGALLDALAAQGAQAATRSFPFTLRTAGLPGGVVELDASESSQLLSALLLVAPHARSPLQVRLKGQTVSRPFVAMTERMLAQFAAKPAEYAVEVDATAASYFLALPLVAGGQLNLTGLRILQSLQGDIEFVNVLRTAGLAVIEAGHGGEASIAKGSPRRGVTADFNAFSDTFLTLAALAPLLDGPTRITGIGHTRRQETDRVAGAARELRKLGQEVIEEEEALTIVPRPLQPDVEIETYNDHRFAMSFAILGCHDLRGDGRPWLWIRHPGCCAKTFPDFFDVLELVWKNSHLSP
jgi:3-phosphoshikimate 1-carboxyvinyltransferase